jgi:hypothetical protein
MNNLEKRKPTELTNEDMADYFLEFGEAATTNGFEGDLLRFNRGDYQAGQQAEVIALGTRMRVRMKKMRVGLQLWQDHAPVDTRMGLVAEGFQPPKRKDLGYLDENEWERDAEGRRRDPWQFCNHVEMIGENGRVFTFATASRGGLSAVGELCKEYGKHTRLHPGHDPIIELDVGSYQHRDKSIGRVKFPILRVIDWVDEDADPDGNAPVTAEPPKPAQKPAAAAKAAEPTAKKIAAAQQPRF